MKSCFGGAAAGFPTAGGGVACPPDFPLRENDALQSGQVTLSGRSSEVIGIVPLHFGHVFVSYTVSLEGGFEKTSSFEGRSESRF